MTISPQANQAVSRILSDGGWYEHNTDQFLAAQQNGASLIPHLLNRTAIDNAIQNEKDKTK